MFTFEPKDEKVSVAQVKFEEVVFCGALKQTERTMRVLEHLDQKFSMRITPL